MLISVNVNMRRLGLALTVLLCASWAPCLKAQTSAAGLVATGDRPNGIYRLGETVGWTLALPSGWKPDGYYYEVRSNGLDVVGGGAFAFVGGRARIEAAATEPAMLYVTVVSKETGARPLAILGAAVAPERLAPAVPSPPDWQSFWQRKLRGLAAVPARAVLSSGDAGRPGVDYATLVMATVDGAHIHGQIARPSGNGRLPGLVIFQYAGGPYPLQKEWVTDRAAQGWLTLNIEPHDVLPDQPQAYYDALPAELKNYASIGRDDRDKSYFLRMYLSAYRAVDYLAGRPDWDGRTLAVMGMSMGGQQALCAAALNHKVTAVIVDVPAGADSNGERHGRLSGYPNWRSDDPRALQAALYFDTVNCAARIRAPTLVAFGFIDTTAPPAGIWTLFNQIRAPKEAVPMVDSPHNHLATAEQQRPWFERSAAWLEALRTSGAPPPAEPTR
jgi:cephalosporin-C deacetylase